MKPIPKNNKKLMYGILGMAWLLIALIGYFYTHKPFSPEETTNLLVAVWRVVIVFGIFSLVGGIGFQILKGRHNQPLSQTTIQAALGLGIVSVATLNLGMWIGFVPWLFATIIILAGFLLRHSIINWWRSWIHLKKAWSQSGIFGKTAAILTLIILSCTFLISLAPPLAFDALTYHLAIPQEYLLEGRVTYLPEIIYWGMPEQTEMLFTLAMLFGGIETGALLGWCIALLALVGTFSFANERLDTRAAWAAVVCLLAGETFSSSLAWGYVEWPSMLFGISMLISLDQWLTGKAPKSAVLAGIFTGMGLATKYTTGILLIAGAIVILSQFKVRNLGATWKALMLFGVSAIIVMLPWLGKNFLATGNPFYPLVFPSGAMDQIRLDFFQKSFDTPTWFETLTIPWQATVWGVEGSTGFSASIGALLLGLSPLAGLHWRERTLAEKAAIKTAAIVACSGFVTWMIANNLAGLLIQSRLYFAIFPAWAVLGGAGFSSFSKLKTMGIRFGRIAAALTLLVFAFAVYEVGVKTQKQGSLDVLLHLLTSDDYLAENLGWYAPAMQAVRELPPDARVLMLWEARSLACLPKCDPDEVIDRWYHDAHILKNTDAIIEEWKSKGYTHLLYYRAGADFVRLENTDDDTDYHWEVLDTLLASLPEINTFGESYSLYLLEGP